MTDSDASADLHPNYDVAPGDLDAAGGDTDRLYINTGSGIFTVSDVNYNLNSSLTVALADLDNDADLGAFVANTVVATGFSSTTARRFYRAGREHRRRIHQWSGIG